MSSPEEADAQPPPKALGLGEGAAGRQLPGWAEGQGQCPSSASPRASLGRPLSSRPAKDPGGLGLAQTWHAGARGAVRPRPLELAVSLTPELWAWDLVSFPRVAPPQWSMWAMCLQSLAPSLGPGSQPQVEQAPGSHRVQLVSFTGCLNSANLRPGALIQHTFSMRPAAISRPLQHGPRHGQASRPEGAVVSWGPPTQETGSLVSFLP